VEFSAGGAAGALDLAALSRIEGVRERPGGNGSVRMQVTNCTRPCPRCSTSSTRQGVPLTELRTHSATLEDVFVGLTGRHLRDE
jgi:ABC-2 type transport system ATP-binding protein